MNNDLISRRELRKAFKKCPVFTEAILYYARQLIDDAPTVDLVSPTIKANTSEEIKQKLIEELQKSHKSLVLYERPTGEWIPVGERLPEDMQRVLVWFEYYRYGDYNCMYQTYGFGYVCDGKWSPFINGETGWQDVRIIAWVPLPEPYKEEENES